MALPVRHFGFYVGWLRFCCFFFIVHIHTECVWSGKSAAATATATTTTMMVAAAAALAAAAIE